MSYWEGHSRELVTDQIPLGLRIRNDQISDKELLCARMMSNLYKSGTSFSFLDSINKLYCGSGVLTEFFSCQSMNNLLCKRLGVSINFCKIVICKVCKRISFGNKVFCQHCYRLKNMYTRRLYGCKCKDCYANNTYWERHCNEKPDVDKVICTHCRTSSPNCIISENPIIHLVSLVNSNQIDLIVDSTEDDIRRHLDYARANKVSSVLITKNIATCLFAMGKKELATDILHFLASFEDPSVIRNSMKEEVDQFVSDSSIEKRCYNLSYLFAFSLSVDTCFEEKKLDEIIDYVDKKTPGLSSRVWKRPTNKAQQSSNEKKKMVNKGVLDEINKRYKSPADRQKIASFYSQQEGLTSEDTCSMSLITG